MADLDPEKLRTGTMEFLGIEAPPNRRSQPTSNEPLRLFFPVPKPEKPKRLPRTDARRTGMSKRQQVLAMLIRPEGVSLDEIVERFGWKRAPRIGCIGYDLAVLWR